MSVEKKIEQLVLFTRGAGGYLTWDELRGYFGDSVFQDERFRTTVLGQFEKAGTITVTDGIRIDLVN